MKLGFSGCCTHRDAEIYALKGYLWNQDNLIVANIYRRGRGARGEEKMSLENHMEAGFSAISVFSAVKVFWFSRSLHRTADPGIYTVRDLRTMA